MSKPRPLSAKPLSVMLSDVFSDVYAKQGFAARELVTRWAEIAGADVAAHCEPLKMQWPRPVEGQPPDLTRLDAGCAFRPRCRFAIADCAIAQPSLEPAADGGHLAACFRSAEIAVGTAATAAREGAMTEEGRL